MRRRAAPSATLASDVDQAHNGSTTASPSPPPTDEPTPTPHHLFPLLLSFRLLNALLTQTYFQPDEHWQSLEIAHRLVFGYGYTTWEWRPSPSSLSSTVAGRGYLSATWDNLLNGPIRSVLHPMVFVPLYALIKVGGWEETRAIVIAPRLMQGVAAATADLYTFKLAKRVVGERGAWCALLVHLTNIYTFFTSARTFSNTLEATLTLVALYHWPFLPFAAWDQRSIPSSTIPPSSSSNQETEDKPTDAKLDYSIVRRRAYTRTLWRSLGWAALACLLRPTGGVVWIVLFSLLLLRTVRQIGGGSGLRRRGGKSEEASIAQSVEAAVEVGQLVVVASSVALGALLLALFTDTLYYRNITTPSSIAPTTSTASTWPTIFNHRLPVLTLTPLSFVHRNVIASLSLFYGTHPWHFYLFQGIPVLLTTWLPYSIGGIVRTIKRQSSEEVHDLLTVSIATVGVYSLLGHKEFRFLQPLVPLFCILAGEKMEASLPPPSPPPLRSQSFNRSGAWTMLRATLTRLPRWQRTILLFINLPVALFLTTFHCRGQEKAVYDIGLAARSQTTGDAMGMGRIESLGVLMPCHSTPWQSSMHWQRGEEEGRAWSMECLPPLGNEPPSSYLDQSDIFYLNPSLYLSTRFPLVVDTSFPPSPPSSPRQVAEKGWRHTWPSHLLMFSVLLQQDEKVKGLLEERGYVKVKKWWNSWRHEDGRREGEVVLLGHRSVL